MRPLWMVLFRYERRYGYWNMNSVTWAKACEKYGRFEMVGAAYRNDHLTDI